MSKPGLATVARGLGSLLLGGVVAGSASPLRTPTPNAVRAAVLHGGWLLTLRADGTIGAWDVDTSKSGLRTPAAPPPQLALALSADGETLWAASNSALWRWSDERREWTQAAALDTHDEKPQGLAVVGGKPLLAFERRVVSPLDAREFAVPEGDGTLQPQRSLRVHALLGGADRLWIASGHGEWGGEVLALDPATGAWATFADTSHYPTGLARLGPEEVAATWTMSHMGRVDSVLRVHGPDAKVRSYAAAVDGRFDQCLAWSPFDNALYAVESDTLISFRDGRRITLGVLEGELYRPEPEAVGAAPGIVALLPVAPRSLFVVPAEGPPWRWDQTKFTRLVPR